MYSRNLVETENHQRCLPNLSAITPIKHSKFQAPTLEDLILQCTSQQKLLLFQFLSHTLSLVLGTLPYTAVSLCSKMWLCWTITAHTKWWKDLQVQLILSTKTRLKHASRELNVIWTEEHHWMCYLASILLQSSCKTVYTVKAWRNIVFTILGWAFESLQMTKVIIKTTHSDL